MERRKISKKFKITALWLALAIGGLSPSARAQDDAAAGNFAPPSPEPLTAEADDPLEGLPINVTPDHLPPVSDLYMHDLKVCYLNWQRRRICKGGPPATAGVRYYVVEPGTLAWQAQIFVASVRGGWQNQHWCGGSLIAEGWVLTAAHCTRDGANAMNDVRVRLGAFNLAAGDGATYRIDRVIVHAGYHRHEKPDDIAMLHIVPDRQLSAAPVYKIAPISLKPPPNNGFERLLIGQQVRTSGWGRTSYKGALMRELGETKLDLMANQQCKAIYGEEFSNRALCAYAPGTDSCEGDSGGPLTQGNDIRKLKLIGIVSFGRGCAEPGVPGVYTRVDSYFDWIQEARKQTQIYVRLNDPLTLRSAR